MEIRNVTTGVFAAAIGLVGILVGVSPVRAESLTVGAGHSLKPAFQEIIPMFEREYGATIHVVYGPSQTLRRHIEKNAPIDVFLSASVEEIEKLRKNGSIHGKTRIYAQTSLVLVMSATSLATPISFHDGLPNRRTRIALGDPKTSALGQITARVLNTFDPAYRSGSNLLYGEHSDAVMNLIETGRADAGIVYRADAIGSGHMRIIDEVPPGRHTPVLFGGAVVSTCRETSCAASEEFLDFLTSPRIQKLLLKYGFDSVPSN